MKTGTKRRVTERFVFANTEEFVIEWRSEEDKRITQHRLALLNPTNNLIIAIRNIWNITEGKLLRWKTAEEIIEEELNK